MAQQALQVVLLQAGTTNNAGNINEGGYAEFLETDGTTLKAVYSDSNKTAATLSTFIVGGVTKTGVQLDHLGQASVFASGEYNINLFDRNGVLIRSYASNQFSPTNPSDAGFVDVSLYGSANNSQRISLAISSIAGADRTLYAPPTEYTIDADIAVPSNINMKIEYGGYFTIPAGKQLTINGTIDAPLYHIFRGAGTVIIDSKNNNVPSAWFGTPNNRQLKGVTTIDDARATTFYLNGDQVTATAAEVNTLDGVTATTAEINTLAGASPGSVNNSKAVLYGSGGEVNTTKLQVGGQDITATPAEMNRSAGATPGVVVNDKNVVYNSSGGISANYIDTLKVQKSVNYKLVSKTATYTAADESVILVDASSGSVTINLPAASVLSGREYTIIKSSADISSNPVTIDPSGSELINGDAQFYLQVGGEQITIICDGTGWHIINSNFDIFSIGRIIPWPGSSAPPWGLELDGSNKLRAAYPRVFAKIGTTWGVGNGTTTFGLPDGRARYFRGRGVGELVGWYFEQKTKLPTTAFTVSSYTHNHSIANVSRYTKHAANDGGNKFGAFDEGSVNQGAITENTNDNTHTHTISGGDAETRPNSFIGISIIRI